MKSRFLLALPFLACACSGPESTFTGSNQLVAGNSSASASNSMAIPPGSAPPAGMSGEIVGPTPMPTPGAEQTGTPTPQPPTPTFTPDPGVNNPLTPTPGVNDFTPTPTATPGVNPTATPLTPTPTPTPINPISTPISPTPPNPTATPLGPEPTAPINTGGSGGFPSIDPTATPMGLGGGPNNGGGAGGNPEETPSPTEIPPTETPPTTPAVACTGAELLCEDFESVANGQVPTGVWRPLDDSCQYQTSQFTMGVSNERANPVSGSTRSLKVTNKHFAQCRLSGGFPVVNEFWLRAYVFWETNLDISNRETLDIDLTPGYRTADDPAVRFGYRSKEPCVQHAGPQITIIGVAGGEVTGCGSRPMPQGQWYCFEAHVQQASVLDVRTYINGEAISYQSVGKPLTQSIATEGPISQKIDHVRLGIFSTGEAQGSIFIDDVAVATSRLGCGN